MLETLGAARGANQAFTKAGLTGISGAATTFSTGATAQSFCVQGKAASKAQVSGGATPTTDINTGAAFVGLTANKGSVFVWAMKLDGTVGVAQGSVEPLDASGAFLQPPQFPMLPDTWTAFSYVIIKAGATTSGTWTFSGSNWNATGITVAVQDIMMLPARPQVS